MSAAPHPLEPGTGRLIPGTPRAPRLCLSCSQGTSSFDEPITEPALRLPTGSRKVLFVTGCWKGHGVLLPLLFLARALSPSDGKRSVRWTPDTPSRCGRPAPGAVGGYSVPAHAAQAPHGPEKLPQGGGSRVPSASRGNNGNLGMLQESPRSKPGGGGSGPGCHQGAPEVPRLQHGAVPGEGCPGCRGECGCGGTPGTSPGSVLQHTHTRSALGSPAQAGQAPLMGRRVTGAFQHWGNVGCAVLPGLTAATLKWGAKREHSSLTTGE